MSEIAISEGEFESTFERFTGSTSATSVTRWEARQSYAVARENPSLAAWRTGAARPERSVRTDPYLAEVATAVLAGKEWTRLRRIEEPLGEYVRWELESFRESQAAGERVLIAVGDPCEMPDVWLFDGSDVADRVALVIRYDERGAPASFGRVDEPGCWRMLRDELAEVEARAEALNVYLARTHR